MLEFSIKPAQNLDCSQFKQLESQNLSFHSTAFSGVKKLSAEQKQAASWHFHDLKKRLSAKDAEPFNKQRAKSTFLPV